MLAHQRTKTLASTQQCRTSACFHWSYQQSWHLNYTVLLGKLESEFQMLLLLLSLKDDNNNIVTCVCSLSSLLFAVCPCFFHMDEYPAFPVTVLGWCLVPIHFQLAHLETWLLLAPLKPLAPHQSSLISLLLLNKELGVQTRIRTGSCLHCITSLHLL